MSAGFQSTPANFTAGDPCWAAVSAGLLEFQSTPANFTAGDFVASSISAPRVAPVSIHARQFHSGRQPRPRAPAALPAVSIHARQFHSGRHCHRWADGCPRRSFNPRPPISQRATGTKYSMAGAAAGFNPRPPISQRATCRSSACWPCCKPFQSTPANFTAGDLHRLHAGVQAEHVSIHARQFHSGRRAPLHARDHARLCFNPRPPISQRATCNAKKGVMVSACFNPRPPISQRATDQQKLTVVQYLVSIHARQFHSGRRLHRCHSGQLTPVSIHARQFHSGRRSVRRRQHS